MSYSYFLFASFHVFSGCSEGCVHFLIALPVYLREIRVETLDGGKVYKKEVFPKSHNLELQ